MLGATLLARMTPLPRALLRCAGTGRDKDEKGAAIGDASDRRLGGALFFAFFEVGPEPFASGASLPYDNSTLS